MPSVTPPSDKSDQASTPVGLGSEHGAATTASPVEPSETRLVQLPRGGLTTGGGPVEDRLTSARTGRRLRPGSVEVSSHAEIHVAGQLYPARGQGPDRRGGHQPAGSDQKDARGRRRHAGGSLLRVRPRPPGSPR